MNFLDSTFFRSYVQTSSFQLLLSSFLVFASDVHVEEAHIEEAQSRKIKIFDTFCEVLEEIRLLPGSHKSNNGQGKRRFLQEFL